jgi:LAO/AO transport system kinase
VAAAPEPAARVVGLTGPPGAGKSTLIDRLVYRARALGRRVAVLAVDPSSPRSGGALLGDRVRMQGHATDPDVFVRSMATRGRRGGLAVATLGAVRALEGAGWSDVLIETVGVGQVEVGITAAADVTVVVVGPGMGDDVQAEKAGLLEVADLVVVNQSDRPGAGEVARHLADRGLTVLQTSALTGDGVDLLWAAVDAQPAKDGARARRMAAEVRELVAARLDRVVAGLAVGEMCDPYPAADALWGSTPMARPQALQ